LVAILAPFIAALLAGPLARATGRTAAWILALVPAAIFVHFASLAPVVASGTPLAGGVDWIPSLDVRFSWWIDGLSLTFALLISGIGTLIVIYSGGYLKDDPRLGRFLAFILLFMGAMQGVVLSDSFLTLFVFWELTSISSFLLIGFDAEKRASRRGAIQALAVTGIGGLSLLAGLLLIGQITGVSELSGLADEKGLLLASPLALAALLLVLGGAFTKSAQFPFHFWLPNAMAAPTPVSAYLHSATMVKAGVYLLMRLNPTFGETDLWQTLLPAFGGTTLLVGALLALRQTDLKLMLAYTTVASLGLLVLLTGFGTETALVAAVLYLVAHSLFKGALFMVAGTIDHEAGTRDVQHLSGLRAVMPITFAAALFAALSMSGFPLFFGFLAKEEVYAALGSGGLWATLFLVAAFAGNALMAAAAFAVAFGPFLGKRSPAAANAHEGPVALWLGPVVLALAGLAAALLSPFMHAFVSSPLASAVAGTPVEVTISTVPHLGLPLLLSVLTLAAGAALYVGIVRVRRAIASVLDIIGWGPDKGFDQALRGLIRFSVAVTNVIQNGRLDVYMTVTFLVLAAALLGPMWAFGEWPAWPSMPSLHVHEWAVLLIAVIGVFAVVRTSDRLTAIVSLGIQGFAVALLFVLFGAPDLAFTQFMVETLSVVILTLVMTRLRLSPSDHRAPRERLADGAIAVALGLGVALVLLRIVQMPFEARLSHFFNAYSRVIAHGRNVVNVIIVDFRGLDTLGEIAVVMTAGLAILALIRIRAKASPSAAGGEER
jgi:multicomponent Na+:H+ antiporter subunit A